MAIHRNVHYLWCIEWRQRDVFHLFKNIFMNCGSILICALSMLIWILNVLYFQLWCFWSPTPPAWCWIWLSTASTVQTMMAWQSCVAVTRPQHGSVQPSASTIFCSLSTGKFQTGHLAFWMAFWYIVQSQSHCPYVIGLNLKI